jgi:hypothetical protein
MNMNHGEEDFEQLRKLLKVKCFEQPPPGYFEHLSARVINRLEREPQSAPVGFFSRWQWLGRLRSVLAENPVSSGIFAVCGVLMVVIANSQYLGDTVLGGVPSPVSVASQPGEPGAQVADNDVTRGSVKEVSETAALSPSTIPGIYPAVSVGAMNSSMNPFSLAVQPVSFSFLK